MGTHFDVVVVGGGPSGATAAQELAHNGRSVLLIDKGGRVKPCGGAIPPRAIRDFDIPQSILTERVTAARMISPSDKIVDMEIGHVGYVGMVDRKDFDPWLRKRAEASGVECITGSFKTMTQEADGTLCLEVKEKGGGPEAQTIHCKMVIGADGANSAVRRSIFGPKRKPPYVFAYHEIIETPKSPPEHFSAKRCDIIYKGEISPDFYGWVFPHGETISVGCGTAVKGHDMKLATHKLREAAGLAESKTLREEGAPLPLKPMRRWDNGRNVILSGDAAGVVAPSSGEGIYYAMLGGQLCARAVDKVLQTGKARHLKDARKQFMKEHGRVFMILGVLQWIWYRSDRRREQFVKMCRDEDVQRLTWESYLNKKLVRHDPMGHLRVLAKDVQQLLGFSRG